MIRRKVTFSVQYEAIIEVDSEEDIEDACSNLNIPEDEQTKYVADTFEVDSVEELTEEDEARFQ